MTGERLEVRITVDGLPVTRRIEPRQHLVDFLREELQLTGAHVGCEHGVCGACTLRVEGQIVRGCLMLAVQADGLRVDTIEGLSERGELADLQAAFLARNALQCGYCTPGMLLTAAELLATRPHPTRAEVQSLPRGQLLPLHRLPGDRRCGPGGRPAAPRRPTVSGRRLGPRPAEQLHRPERAAAERAPPAPGPGPVRRRHPAAAHGPRRLLPRAHSPTPGSAASRPPPRPPARA